MSLRLGLQTWLNFGCKREGNGILPLVSSWIVITDGRFYRVKCSDRGQMCKEGLYEIGNLPSFHRFGG